MNLGTGYFRCEIEDFLHVNVEGEPGNKKFTMSSPVIAAPVSGSTSMFGNEEEVYTFYDITKRLSDAMKSAIVLMAGKPLPVTFECLFLLQITERSTARMMPVDRVRLKSAAIKGTNIVFGPSNGISFAQGISLEHRGFAIYKADEKRRHQEVLSGQL